MVLINPAAHMYVIKGLLSEAGNHNNSIGCSENNFG